MARHDNILIRPVITERGMKQIDKLNKYTFEVAPDANKLEIKAAVEEQFNVTVVDVNTSVVPAKKRTQYRNRKFTVGYRQGYKKAIVTLPEGEYINFLGEAPAEG